MFSFQVCLALTGALHRVTLTGTDATSITPRYLHTRINTGEPAAKLPTVAQAAKHCFTYRQIFSDHVSCRRMIILFFKGVEKRSRGVVTELVIGCCPLRLLAGGMPCQNNPYVCACL